MSRNCKGGDLSKKNKKNPKTKILETLRGTQHAFFKLIYFAISLYVYYM